MVKDGTFVKVESWMVNELGLRGAELLAFALVHGACASAGDARGENAWSHFSMAYIAEWCGVSKRAAIDLVARLVAKGVLVRGERDRFGAVMLRPAVVSAPSRPCTEAGRCDDCTMKKLHLSGEETSSDAGEETSLGGEDTSSGGEVSSPNTDSSTYGVKEPKDTLSGKRHPRYSADELEAARRVVEHLNSVTGSRFRASSASTLRHVVARLRDGMTVDDLFAVVDAKAAEWGRRPEMAVYLRPETLFGSKCEGYLQAAGRRCGCVPRELPGWAVAMQASMPVIGGLR